MISEKFPVIKVNRVAVFSGGISVYDEIFHDGINIIRGENSSGKSTIINFIYFVLGGDLRRWTPQADKCDSVIAEVQLSDIIVTLKRHADSTRRSLGMYIFYGPISKALQSAEEGWEHYSFARTENKLSFSQVLFNALGFPEVKSDLNSAITMHQILRVIFVDQLDVADTLIRYEKFDSKLTCSTIGDILYGVYDDELYEEQKNLTFLDKEIAVISQHADNLVKALHEVTGENILRIEELYTSKEEQLVKIDLAINKFKTEERARYNNNTTRDLEDLQKQLSAAKTTFNQKHQLASDLKLEIEDSNLFITALESQKEELQYSINTKKALGELSLTNCPSCLSKLPTAEEGLCLLCKEKSPVEIEKSQAFRMAQEIDIQIKESVFLQEKRNKKFVELQSEIKILSVQINTLQKQINQKSTEADATYINELEKLYIQKGKTHSELDYILKQRKSYDNFIELKSRKSMLESRRERITTSIQQRQNIRDQRARKAKIAVQNYALEILKDDKWQQEFQTAKYISVDFSSNSFSLDGRSSFSASSLVYLKNAIRFAIFFASLELKFMRYPRFIICDNVEDKGMQEARSQQFQKSIFKIAARFNKINYQIIYSTSMIETSLNNTANCIGPEYHKGQMSLKL